MYTNNIERQQLKQFADKAKKSLTIKYISCSKDDKFIHLRFEATAQNLKENKAVVYVDELDSLINDTAVPKTDVTISANGTVGIMLKFDKNKDFTENFYDDGNVFQATTTCDGLSAKSDKFKLSFGKEENQKKKCFCNRDFSVDEIKNIVIELRKNTFYDKKSIFSFYNDKIFHRNVETKEEYKDEVINVEEQTFEKMTFVLNKIFKEYKINQCIKKISFLSQMYIETAFFTSTIELTHNKQSYDPYRGRGFIQLTHEGNEDSRTKNATSYLGYKKYSKLDVITNPSIISKSLYISADSAGWFWTRGVRKIDGNLINLNEKAGNSFEDYKELTRLIKGSASELKERYDAFQALIKIMNYEKCISK